MALLSLAYLAAGPYCATIRAHGNKSCCCLLACFLPSSTYSHSKQNKENIYIKFIENFFFEFDKLELAQI